MFFLLILNLALAKTETLDEYFDCKQEADTIVCLPIPFRREVIPTVCFGDKYYILNEDDTRLFDNIKQQTANTMSMALTLELEADKLRLKGNKLAKELEWFIEKYPNGITSEDHWRIYQKKLNLYRDCESKIEVVRNDFLSYLETMSLLAEEEEALINMMSAEGRVKKCIPLMEN